MRKIVINDCYGGFGVSEAGMRRYAEIKGINLWVKKDRFGYNSYMIVPPSQEMPEMDYVKWHGLSIEERKAHNEQYRQQQLNDDDFARDDPVLVQVVEELGTEKASDRFANLKIVEIPDDVKWQIEEYDGTEWVAEEHRTWS